MPLKLLSSKELHRRLQPYGCRKMMDLPGGWELWRTGWGTAFSFEIENGEISERQYFNIIFYKIDKTMPPGWRFIEDEDGS